MTSRLRVGRMARWQRWTTYAALSLCAASGIGWFAMIDVVHAAPSQARVWWVAHGVTALLATMVIGAAVGQHVIVTWRGARGRWSGSLNLALLVGLAATAALLMYGSEATHDPVHWIHAIAGLVAVVAFAWHVVWGKTRVAKLGRFAAAKQSPH